MSGRNSVTGAARAALLAVLLASARPAAAAPTDLGPPDYPVEMGHFYTQTGIGLGTGFAILNEFRFGIRMEPFWDEFQRLGGVPAFGYPISGVFRWAELNWAQLTQKSLLYWDRYEGRLIPANIFEILESEGLDGFLESQGIPRPIASDGAENFEQAVTIRLGWLENERLRAAYFANPNPAQFRRWTPDHAIFLRGLPMSKPQRMGPFIAQRFQKAAMQLWVERVPGGPPPGSVTLVNAGDYFKMAGLLPDATAGEPHGPANMPFSLGPGMRLAFTSQRTGTTQVYISTPQGAHLSAITRTDNVVRYPAWSPDGTKLAFARGAAAPAVDQRREPSAGDLIAGRIVVHDIETGQETTLSPEGLWAASPAWSPDGASIVYSGWADLQNELYVVRVADGQNLKLLALPADQSQPAWAPDGRTVLFVSDHEGPSQIYAIDPDGMNLRRLTHGGEIESGPRWSPDGGRIAFARFVGSSWDVFLMNADGSGERRITTYPGADLAPAFTPDGQFLAFVRERVFDQDIYVVDLQSGAEAKLTGEEGADRDPSFTVLGSHPGGVNAVPPEATLVFYSSSIGEGPNELWATSHTSQPLDPVRVTAGGWVTVLPAWSTDGRRLAFTSSRDGTLDLFTVRTDGMRLSQLTNAGSLNGFAAYSPDGSKILFSSDRQGRQNLFTVNPDGAGMSRITFSEANDVDAVWGADGDEIIFASDRDGSYDIYRIRLSDLRAIQLTNSPGDARNPTISPDGNTIVFAVHSGRGEGIWVMRPDGSEIAPLISDGWEYRMPAWSPDGKLIAFASKRSAEGTYAIYVMNPFEGVLWQVADTPGNDLKPVWRPGIST